MPETTRQETTEISNDAVGKIVDATCEDAGKKNILFTFGKNARVAVPANEWPTPPASGSHYEILIESIDENALWHGSAAKVAPMRLWQKIQKIQKEAQDIDVTPICAGSGGLICDVESLMGFMPKREFGDAPQPPESYIGKSIKARILKFSPKDGRLLVSRKAAMAQAIREAREALLKQLAPGQRYTGTVKKVTEFGVFVDIGSGVEGLVHRSNLSWNNEDPAAITAVGDALPVVVLALENGRIALGHKQLIEDTWVKNIASCRAGDIVTGKVTSLANFGAFVRLENGIEGLVHASELSWNPAIRQPKQCLAVGDIVQTRVMSIDEPRRRLRLSLRRAGDNPWENLKSAYPAGAHATFPVAGIADFGIFLDMGNGLRGLVHKNDMSWLPNSIDIPETYHIGDNIECVVLEIDPGRERAALGIKQLSGDPWRAFLDQKPLGCQFPAEIRRITEFGAFAAIDGTQIEGLIHISQLSDRRVSHPGDVVKIGQRVTVTVIALDDKRRRAALSLIAAPFEPDAEQPVQPDVPAKPPTMGDIFPEGLKHA